MIISLWASHNGLLIATLRKLFRHNGKWKAGMARSSMKQLRMPTCDWLADVHPGA